MWVYAQVCMSAHKGQRRKLDFLALQPLWELSHIGAGIWTLVLTMKQQVFWTAKPSLQPLLLRILPFTPPKLFTQSSMAAIQNQILLSLCSKKKKRQLSILALSLSSITASPTLPSSPEYPWLIFSTRGPTSCVYMPFFIYFLSVPGLFLSLPPLKCHPFSRCSQILLPVWSFNWFPAENTISVASFGCQSLLFILWHPSLHSALHCS